MAPGMIQAVSFWKRPEAGKWPSAPRNEPPLWYIERIGQADCYSRPQVGDPAVGQNTHKGLDPPPRAIPSKVLVQRSLALEVWSPWSRVANALSTTLPLSLAKLASESTAQERRAGNFKDVIRHCEGVMLWRGRG